MCAKAVADSEAGCGGVFFSCSEKSSLSGHQHFKEDFMEGKKNERSGIVCVFSFFFCHINIPVFGVWGELWVSGEREPRWIIPPPPTLALSLSLSLTHTHSHKETVDFHTAVQKGQTWLCVPPLGSDSAINIDYCLSAAHNAPFFFPFSFFLRQYALFFLNHLIVIWPARPWWVSHKPLSTGRCHLRGRDGGAQAAALPVDGGETW